MATFKIAINTIANCLTTGRWRAARQIHKAVRSASTPTTLTFAAGGSISNMGQPLRNYRYPMLGNLTNGWNVTEITVMPQASTAQISADLKIVQEIIFTSPSSASVFHPKNLAITSYRVSERATSLELSGLNRIAWIIRSFSPIFILNGAVKLAGILEMERSHWLDPAWFNSMFLNFICFYAFASKFFNDAKMVGARFSQQAIILLKKSFIIVNELLSGLIRAWRKM